MRSLLDGPYPNAPTFHSLFRQELAEEQDILNQTNNSGVAWSTAEYQLNYTEGVTNYQIQVSDWGKVLFVVKETGNQYIPYIPVPFDDLSNQQYGTILGYFNNAYVQSWTLASTPERMSFSRSGVLDASYMVSIQPAPQGSAVYIITYLPGYLGTEDPLEAAIQMPEHAELVRLRGATAQLNYARWYEDEEKNRQKRKDLAEGFAYQLQRKEKIFERYLGNINIPQMTEIGNWCDDPY